jgi:hypothetical protein
MGGVGFEFDKDVRKFEFGMVVEMEVLDLVAVEVEMAGVVNRDTGVGVDFCGCCGNMPTLVVAGVSFKLEHIGSC